MTTPTKPTALTHINPTPTFRTWTSQEAGVIALLGMGIIYTILHFLAWVTDLTTSVKREFPQLKEIYISAPHSKPASDYPVWKTVKIGSELADIRTFRENLYAKGFYLEGENKIWKNYEDRQFNSPVSTNRSVISSPHFKGGATGEFDLVVVSAKDLGLRNYDVAIREIGYSYEKHPFYGDLIERVKSLGFELCPPEVALVLRSQYAEQPLGEDLYVGMEAIPYINDYSIIFALSHRTIRENQGIYTREGTRKNIRDVHTVDKSNQQVDENDRFILVRPRK